MLDIGWSELLVIAIVLIVVVGPKDLPPMLRAFGKMTTNLRRMAGEFRSQFDEALRDTELDEVRKTIADAKNLNPTNSLRDALNPIRQMGEDIKSDLSKVTKPPVTPAPAPEAPAEPLAQPGDAETAAPVTPPPQPLPDAGASAPPAEVKPAVAPAPVAAPVAKAAAKPKPVRKPRAAAAVKADEKPAAKPSRTSAKTQTDGTAVKKAPTRRKKTAEPGKDQA
ncbi:Sec-independent protein translocase protein TatB [Rhizobiaceae bacterium BDR2-2]|uniref:Sec-independent protein translocase protein TatB n=1 Tax=Ectorhizobium quercum TaxID=2965071 RepID=A0AAE3SUY5_9HYPH|nr:Sec-independent protein translocase protein TatB [Ectorhizobium quercum]MCX8997567.1 Sec-independent protein translocase protein TatB [Ectorhizobium quercum]